MLVGTMSVSHANFEPGVGLQGSPMGRPFGEFVQAAGVTMLGVVPSMVKAWRSSACMQVRPMH